MTSSICSRGIGSTVQQRWRRMVTAQRRFCYADPIVGAASRGTYRGSVRPGLRPLRGRGSRAWTGSCPSAAGRRGRWARGRRRRCSSPLASTSLREPLRWAARGDSEEGRVPGRVSVTGRQSRMGNAWPGLYPTAGLGAEGNSRRAAWQPQPKQSSGGGPSTTPGALMRQ